MSIRLKLTISFVIVVLVANGILSLTILRSLETAYLEEVQTRVRLDLQAARTLYEHQTRGITAVLRAVAVRRPIANRLSDEVRDDLGRVLDTILKEGDLDILTLADADARVVYRAHNPGCAGDSLVGLPLVARAIRERAPVQGTFLLPPDILARDGAALVERAAFGDERTGMAVGAAVPFVSVEGAGRTLGVLFGAKLLDRRYDFVDALQAPRYPPRGEPGRGAEAATIFRGDLRVATSARDADGERLVGTRLDAAARDRVLDHGRTWGDRAKVVGDWYFAAYEPIRDPGGAIIGALGVALLEAPFTEPQRAHRRFFLLTTAAASATMLLLLFLLTRTLLRPIAHVARVCERITAGEFGARVGIRPSGEMGILCRTVDHMADAIVAREDALRRATERQIGRSEQLASIGRLAAGVAHEINNPLTGVLMFAHLLQEREGRDEQDRADLQVIVDETTRVSAIVRSLLDFARESAPSKTLLQINEVLRETIPLAAAQVDGTATEIEERLAEDLPPVPGDRNQLKQVFLNLMLNAIEAMPEGGTLTLATSSRDGSVVVGFSDTGCGIPAQHRERIFDPFFTTKPVGKGTGLGLSVSYGIVHQHGGSLEIESEVGRGTTVRVVLPCDGGEQA